jgi:PAS domain S-box-containing protein
VSTALNDDGPTADTAPPAARGLPVLRVILVAGPILALVGGVVALLMSPERSNGYLVGGVLIPSLIVVLLAAGIRRRRALFAAAILINIEAILAGLLLSTGIAVAIVLPLISVALIRDRIPARTLLWASVGAAIVSTIGIALAILVGPASSMFAGSGKLLMIASFTILVAFALALEWQVVHRLRHALDAAEGELAARRRAERELEHTSHLLSAIVDASPLATQAFTLDRTVTVWNPASERIFGWTADEVIGRPMPREMTPDEDRQSSAERIQRTVAGEVMRGERVRRLTKDGREIWVEIYGSALHDPDGRPIGLAGQLADVTERVRLDAQLAHAQRLEAIGRLAGGVAHDFNNTLTAIGGFATLIGQEAEDAAAVRSDAATIGDVVERSRHLTSQLLAFARRATLQPALVDLRATTADLEPVLCRLLPDGVDLRVTVPAEPLRARVDAIQLEQALANLVANARDAMPGGGTVELAVRRVAISPGDVAEDPALAGPFVEIGVHDTGAGIDPAVVPNVFEPFFTTKGPGRGTGLGLALVRDFVKQSGGHVCLDTRPGEGTCVRLRFPDAGARTAPAG